MFKWLTRPRARTMFSPIYGHDINVSETEYRNYVNNELVQIRRELQMISTKQHSLQPKMVRTANGDAFSLENLVFRLAEQSGLAVKIKPRYDGDDFECSPRPAPDDCPQP